jgi:hypothetical protein
MKVEEQIQKQIFQYLELQYPDVIAISEPSGLRVSMGLAKKLKSLRTSDTHADIYILEPNKWYHGLIIELKAKNIYKKDGTLLKDEHLQDQQKMIDRLIKKGYKAKFAVGFDEAKKIIDEYLK